MDRRARQNAVPVGLLGACTAYEQLRALLDSGPLRIERKGNDRYGRTLARVYAGGINVGQTLLAEGYVLPYQPGSAAKRAAQ